MAINTNLSNLKLTQVLVKTSNNNEVNYNLQIDLEDSVIAHLDKDETNQVRLALATNAEIDALFAKSE